MSHSFSQNHIHLIFSTKDRSKTIPEEMLPRLCAYLGGICKNHEMTILAVGGTENHVYLLFHLPSKLALAKAVLLLKANSSKWMSEQGVKFEWQGGYGAFSVSFSNLDAAIRYIHGQEAHHRKVSFEDEFREILKMHRVEYDPKYLFG
ncbi:MAG TPA: IS200/IS605 family transposase [Candidatus Acidoferrales bacterium]|nr:IS200/IS605 family transposase [Candidatus Acidoferrales bacterium]